MPDKKAPMNPHMTARQLGLLFVAFLVAHVAVVYAANMFFPEDVVLGNHFFSPTMGLIYAMLPFTVVTVLAIPFIEHVADTLNRKVSNLEWMVDYFVINTAGLWVLGRFAEWVGMGISSWMVAVALSLVMTFLQGIIVGMVMKPAEK